MFSVCMSALLIQFISKLGRKVFENEDGGGNIGFYKRGLKKKKSYVIQDWLSLL